MSVTEARGICLDRSRAVVRSLSPSYTGHSCAILEFRKRFMMQTHEEGAV
jgi:hypothetical protein